MNGRGVLRTIQALAVIGLFWAAAVWGADRVSLSVTNLTAFEWDLLVAQDRKFFEREGLDVKITYMAPPLVINALIAGEVNIAKSGTHFGVIAASRGADVKIIAAGLYGFPYDLISRPEFKSLADLKGQKIIGATLASVITVIFKDAMARQGIGPSDYTMLFVGGSAERYQALKSGQVAASVAEAPPFNFHAIDGGERALLRYSHVIKNLQYLSYFTTGKLATTQGLVLARFVGAVSQAQRWLNEPGNEAQAIQILASHLKIDERTAVRTYRYLIAEDKAYRGAGKIDGAGLAEVIRLLADYEMIAKRERWESLVGSSFLP